MFERFSHPMYYVLDLARAVRWYTEVLGFETRFHAPGSYASLFHPELKMRLDLHPTEANSKDVGFGCLNYFSTKAFDQAIETLRGKGVKVGEPRREGGSPRFVTFWDSEGNALGIEELL
jgi:catechol 2,3-dioxygenase-like lactoylglutathione lyase family enzyme